MKTSQGVILISCLLLLALASSLGLLVVFCAYDIFAAQTANLAYLKKSEKSLESLYTSIGTGSSSSEGIDCLSDKSGSHIPYTLCSVNNKSQSLLVNQPIIEGVSLVDKSLFPKFDFNYELAGSEKCPLVREQSDRKTSFGVNLSEPSSIWHLTCTIQNGKISALRFLANIESNQNLTSAVPPLGPSIIVTPGFIHLNGNLTVKSDFIILAGGDVILNQIIVTGSPRITLISTKGSVSVLGISGTPQLKLVSWLGSWVNGKAAAQSEQLFPKTNDMQIIGIY